MVRWKVCAVVGAMMWGGMDERHKHSKGMQLAEEKMKDLTVIFAEKAIDAWSPVREKY